MRRLGTLVFHGLEFLKGGPSSGKSEKGLSPKNRVVEKR